MTPDPRTLRAIGERELLRSLQGAEVLHLRYRIRY
jgi:hypothetical protein